MKTLCKVLCVLAVIMNSPVQAEPGREPLAGEWHGEVASKQGNTNFIFRFNTTASGILAGTVNIAGATGNGLPFEHIEFKDNKLKLTFNSGKAVYHGQVSGDTLTGELQTGTVAVPLRMEKGMFVNPYALNLTKEQMGRLNGEWHGVFKLPQGPLLMIFRFGQNAAGEYVGFADNPYYSDFNAPVTAAVLDGNNLAFKIPNLLMALTGRLEAGNITASVRMRMPYTGSFPIILEKGHYEIPDLSCNLPHEAVEKLMGTWTGYIDPPGSRMENIFHVARRADGKVYCFHDNPTMGFYGSIMINQSWDNGRMVFKTLFPNDSEFKARLSGKTISGSWHPGSMTVPAHYEKIE